MTWDLHHYFEINQEEIDIQFDISFFKDWTMPNALSSYKANDFANRIPAMALNVLSKSTWRTDFSENLELCRIIGIPIYVVFSPYLVTSCVFRPPFLCVYFLQEDGRYQQIELRKITLMEGGELDPDAIIDVGDRLPFRFGLMQLIQKHIEEMPLFRVILISPNELRILPTAKDQIKEERDQIKEERDQIKEERDQIKEELEQYKEKFGEL